MFYVRTMLSVAFVAMRIIQQSTVLSAAASGGGEGGRVRRVKLFIISCRDA